MTKKLLALSVSVLMVISMFCAIPVSATVTLPANIGADYEATDVLEGNLFTDETTTGVTRCDAMKESIYVHQNIKLEGESAAIANGDVSSSNYNTGGGGTLTSNREVLDPWSVYTDTDGDGIFTIDSTKVDYRRALAGIALQLNKNNNATDDRRFMTPDYKKNVVVSIPFTMVSGSGNAVVNIARSKYQILDDGEYPYIGYVPSDHEYPIEYNGRDQGITVSETGRTYLNATFLGSTAESDPRYTYTLGMVMGTDAGIKVRMEEDEFYIGYEYAKDLIVEADSTKLIAGLGAITVDADVLNQVGNKGGLSQDVTWYALNEARNATVEGLTIAEGADGTVTVSAASTVPAGTYTLVAVADADDALVKGITITVENTDLSADYTSTDVLTGNLFTNESAGCNAYNGESNVHKNMKLEGESAAIAKGDVSCSNSNTGDGGNMTSLRKVLDPWAVYADADGDGVFTLDTTKMDYTYPLAGIQLKLNSSVANNKYPTPDYKKNVVVRVPLTMKSGSGTAIVNVARSIKNTSGVPSYTHSGKKASDYQYPIEYNGRDQGVTVAAEGTTYLNATFAGNTTAATDPQYSYTLGMVMGTDAGITLHMDEAEFYIGYEYAKDLTVGANNTNLVPGIGSITVDADVLNQAGNKGGLSQGVAWYALNEARNAAVEGFTIVEGADGTATISAASTVAAGTYKLVAVADEDSRLVKAVTVTVLDLTQDYVAGAIEGNLYNPVDGEAGKAVTNSGSLVGDNEGNMTISYSSAIGDGVDTLQDNGIYYNESAAYGAQISKNYTTFTDIYKDGETFIFGAQIKKTAGNPKFTAGFGQDNRVPIRPRGYGVCDGYEITSTEFAPVCLTIDVSNARTDNNWRFQIGFPEDPAGSTDTSERTMVIKSNSIFIGYEAAHDMNTTVTGNTTFAEGTEGTFTVNADIINQVGVEGNLSQDVSWYALNEARNAEVSGITVTEDEDGLATVSVASTVPAGTYKLVAVADEYTNIVKSVDITVGEAAPVFTEITIAKTEGGITISTNKDLTNVQLIFAKYEYGRLVAANIDTKVTLAAQGTQEYSIPKGFESAKVMLWEDLLKCVPLAKALN